MLFKDPVEGFKGLSIFDISAVVGWAEKAYEAILVEVRRSNQRRVLSSAEVVKVFGSVGDQIMDLIVAVCSPGVISVACGEGGVVSAVEG